MLGLGAQKIKASEGLFFTSSYFVASSGGTVVVGAEIYDVRVYADADADDAKQL
jgi:hypothetical protein